MCTNLFVWKPTILNKDVISIIGEKWQCHWHCFNKGNSEEGHKGMSNWNELVENAFNVNGWKGVERNKHRTCHYWSGGCCTSLIFYLIYRCHCSRKCFIVKKKTHLMDK